MKATPKIRLAALLCLLPALGPARAEACSVFSCVLDGGRVLARNFDWHDGAGHLLYTAAGAPRLAESGFSWNSRLATLTFRLDRQPDGAASIGGVNSKGLAVEAVWQAGAQYPAGGGLTAPEWITYSLDNYSSARELLAAAPALPVSAGPEPLHFMGCDPEDCFVLEYQGGRPKAYSGDALPYAALTNAAYARAVAALPEFTGFGGGRDMAGSSPLPRFARAAYFLSQGGRTGREAVFAALDSLKIPSGRTSTKWSYVYTLPAAEITFSGGRTYSLPAIIAQHPGETSRRLPLPY